jgi:hypothetical protein
MSENPLGLRRNNLPAISMCLAKFTAFVDAFHQSILMDLQGGKFWIQTFKDGGMFRHLIDRAHRGQMKREKDKKAEKRPPVKGSR